MSNNINFFWAIILIFYDHDPLEFLTGACQTHTGQKMVISHLCVLGDCRSMNSTVQYIIRKLYLPMQGQYMTYPLGSTLRADIIPRMTKKTNTDDTIFTAILVVDWSILNHWSILKDLSFYHKWITYAHTGTLYRKSTASSRVFLTSLPHNERRNCNSCNSRNQKVKMYFSKETHTLHDFWTFHSRFKIRLIRAFIWNLKIYLFIFC